MVDGERLIFTGSEDDVRNDIGAFGEAGVQVLVVAPAGRDVNEMLDNAAGLAALAKS